MNLRTELGIHSRCVEKIVRIDFFVEEALDGTGRRLGGRLPAIDDRLDGLFAEFLGAFLGAFGQQLGGPAGVGIGAAAGGLFGAHRKNSVARQNQQSEQAWEQQQAQIDALQQQIDELKNK